MQQWNVYYGQIRKGKGKGVYFVLNLFPENCFLPELWLPPFLTLAIPAVQIVISTHLSLLGRCQPLCGSTCHPPVSAGSSASLPFSSSLLNLCPASNNPYSVVSMDLASSTKNLLPASCWLPSWKLKPFAKHLAD